MTTIHIDFETRSTVDLKKAGLDVYARHPSTDVWCMAYAIGEMPVELCTPANPIDWDGHRTPTLREQFKDWTVIAHNAQFELAIWNNIMVPRYGWPELKIEQTYCTMAMAYAMALPGSLEKAAAAVGIEAQKDMAGHRVMMQLSKPRSVNSVCPDCDGSGTFYGNVTTCHCVEWWNDPAKLETLYRYCKQDIEVERQLYKRLLPLSPAERRLWILDQKINNRGVAIDVPSARKAIALVAAEKKRLDEEMRKVTGNAVATCTATGQLTQWLRWRGVEVPSVAKADVLDLLAGDLPDDCRAALLLRQEAAKSSTAKLDSMIEVAAVDGRARGLFQYHGAGTGRWAGRKIQTQNMQRPVLAQEDIEDVFEILGGVA